MARRIIIINEHAPTLDTRSGITKVPVRALRQGDVTSANGEKVISVRRATDSDRFEVVLAKNGHRRHMHWHEATLVGVSVRVNDAPPTDGVGTPEEIAYGEGWHSKKNDNPYESPEERAAWEKGRKAVQQRGRMTSGYFKGEVRGRRFEPPRARQVDIMLGEKDKPSYYDIVDEAGKVYATVSKSKALQTRVKLEQETGKKLELRLTTTGSRDYKSEKGYVAKILNVATGGELARSEPYISNGVALKAWIQGKAGELIRQGKRVKAEVVVVFFDPLKI